MSVVFVTGKSGSGKSTFARMLAERLDYSYIDVDEIGHKLYNNLEVIKKLEQLFGNKIYDEGGKFDRKKLGEIVFSNANSPQVVEFNDFTWNCMQKDLDEKMKDNVVVDWVLLPQTTYWSSNGFKILVESKNDESRLEKIKSRDNISEEYLKKREKAGIEYAREDFDFVVENDYKMESMQKAAENVANNLKKSVVVKVLGCVSPFCGKDEACPSYLIAKGDTQILLDCGNGSHRFFDMSKIDGLNILISHLHRDHYCDVFNYQYSSLSLERLGRMKEKLKIYVPEFESISAQEIVREPNAFAEYFEINQNTKYRIGDFEIEFCEVEHSSKQVKTYAMKLTCEKRKIVYSADVSYASKEKLVSFAEGADLFICEASLLKEHGFPKVWCHLTAEQAGEIARLANVKKLMLTHFWAEEERKKYLDEAREQFKNVMLAKEEKEIYLF